MMSDKPSGHSTNMVPTSSSSGEATSEIIETISCHDTVKDEMKQVFLSLIGNIDEQILKVGQSQSELNNELDTLLTKLSGIRIDESLTDQICANSKRITDIRSRMIVCQNILNNSSDRCNRILVAATNLKQSTSLTSHVKTEN